jgi:hypothetical protein
VEESTRPTPEVCHDNGLLHAIPCASNLPPRSSHGRRLPESTNNNFGARFDVRSTCQFDSVSKILDSLNGVKKIDSKLEWNGGLSTDLVQLHDYFGGRYSFDASLSAASLTAHYSR